MAAGVKRLTLYLGPSALLHRRTVEKFADEEKINSSSRQLPPKGFRDSVIAPQTRPGNSPGHVSAGTDTRRPSMSMNMRNEAAMRVEDNP
jgi:hypothetical protein